jgi:hypothetical protein
MPKRITLGTVSSVYFPNIYNSKQLTGITPGTVLWGLFPQPCSRNDYAGDGACGC